MFAPTPTYCINTLAFIRISDLLCAVAHNNFHFYVLLCACVSLCVIHKGGYIITSSQQLVFASDSGFAS